MSIARVFAASAGIFVSVLFIAASACGAPVAQQQAAVGDQQAKDDAVVARFHQWCAGVVATPSAESKARLLPVGLALAKERREALKRIIREDPARALTLAETAAVRRSLPPEVAGLLEERISGVGEIRVRRDGAATAEVSADGLAREARVNGRVFAVHVYGWRLVDQDFAGVPLEGVAVDDVLAVAESPLRVLDPEEVAPQQRQPGKIAAEVGGQLRFFSTQEEVARAELELMYGCGARVPGPEQQAALARMKKVRRVHPNALAWQRINERRQQQGLSLLNQQQMNVVPLGQELELDDGATPAGAGPAPMTAGRADNSALQYFPPIRNQGNLGSCVAFSTTYYQMTYMTAMARGWDAKNGGDSYRFSPKWTYNMINGGCDCGSYNADCLSVQRDNGCATWSEFPYDTNYRAWCLNSNVWRSAIGRRMNDYYVIGNLYTSNGLANLKAILDNGYIVTFDTYAPGGYNGWVMGTVANDPATTNDDPFVGQQICKYVHPCSEGHSMTVVGYNDDIWCDFNGNGVVDPGEKGALIIANSWGNWANGGYVWFAYDALNTDSAVPGWNPSDKVYGFGYGDYAGDCLVFVVTAKPSYTPQMLASFTINHARRNQVTMEVGKDSGTSTGNPAVQWTGTALNGDGGAYAFDGTTNACDGTFWLDMTDLAPDLDQRKRYFVGMTDWYTDGMGGQIKSYTLVDTATGVQTTVTPAANPGAFNPPDGLADGSTAWGFLNRFYGMSAWQQWQLDYFGCTNCPQAADSADPDGDGQNNLTEFLAGMDPTNSVSSWRIQASPTNGPLPLTVSFTDNSTGSSITNRLWSFGDGGVSSGANPSHTYTNAGTFSVGLTVLNLYGTTTLAASNLITVSPFAVWTNANASGNWSEATSWNPVAIPDYGASVIFGTGGVTAMVDNVSRTVGNITFSRSGNFFITASGGAALTIKNGIAITANFTYTISAPVVLGGTNIWLVTSNGTLQVSGPVSGTNSVTKTGGGILIFSGTNTYSGRTTVSNGTLQVTGAGLLTNTVSIDIVSGATLDVSGRTGGSMTLVSGQTLMGGGTVQGDLILVDGSTLSPGSSVGTLTFLNDLVMSNAAVLQYDLGTNSDLTVVSSNLTLGGTLNIHDAGGFTAGGYTLFTYGGALTCNGVAIGTTPDPSYTYTIDTNTAGQVKLNVVVRPSTIHGRAGALEDQFGNLAPANSIAVLVVDTGNNGFVDPQSGFALAVGAPWGSDDKVVCLWEVASDGYLENSTVVTYTDGIAPGQRLQLYWFPSLTLASNVVGVTYYGKYTDTNSPPLDGSGAWEMPAGGSDVELDFFTAYWGGSNPEAAGQATNLTAEPLLASFTAGPTNGVAPLAVTFTDTSTGTISNRFWNFGDGNTSNTTVTTLSHTYGAGIYNVTLVVSGDGAVSTNTKPGYITVWTPFAAWQQQYFGCAACPQAAETADPDGDGQNNLAEFLAGTNPTNSASAFRILSLAQESNNIRITWVTAGGHTNIVQSASNLSGSYSNVSPNIIVTGSGETTTNYLDLGGATNGPAHFYRIRLVP